MAQPSARIGGACFAMGEAAGTVAAMSLAHDSTPRAVQVKPLQPRLESEGAILTPRA